MGIHICTHVLSTKNQAYIDGKTSLWLIPLWCLKEDEMDVHHLICCPSMYFSLIHVHHSFTIVKSCPTRQIPLLWAWVGDSVNEGGGAGGQPWCVMEGVLIDPAVSSRGWVEWRTLSEQPWGQLECLHSQSWTSSGMSTPMSRLLCNWLVLWTCIKLLGSKDSLLFSTRVTDEHGSSSSALGQLICNSNTNSRLPSYSLNYIMLILTHYPKLSNLVLCHWISVVSSDNLMSLEIISKKYALEGPRMESWDEVLEISF